MCFAVGKTIRDYYQFARPGRRQMALIMLTDESGEKEDSMRALEAALQTAKDCRCRVYVLGREAVFGYPYAYMRWKDVKTSINYWLRIDRGPETPFVEQLQTNGFWRRFDAHGSGFGPYEQSRLARETGGIFFVLPSPEVNLVRSQENFKYELERLRPYLPSLETREYYLQERSRSPLQQLIWKVINDLNPWDEQKGKIINLRDDFSIDPAQFTQQARVELNKTKLYVRYLAAAEEAMDKALPIREREVYPRWQANFDLIHAQVIAYKVRVYQYWAYMNWWLNNPDDRPKPALKPPRNNPNLVPHWDITTRPMLLDNENYPKEQMDADIARATRLLKRVVEEYEGTPWSQRAAYELRRGFGVHVVQGWDDRRRNVGVKLPKP